jgi:geranylgeranyl reductase family protein
MDVFDVVIVGGGPAGSSCAAFCAAAGLRTVLIEREKFPREKVCGDCINPACWPILRRLEVAERVRGCPHGKLARVEFIGISGTKVSVALPAGDDAEIAVKRSIFDHLLLDRSRELGAEIHESATVTALTPPDPRAEYWKISVGEQTFEARALVAADGRNSSVARLCGLLPRSTKERIALQTHLPLPPDFGDRVVLEFRPEGYSGQAPVGNGELNLCLVSVPKRIASLRAWAEERFHVPANHPWRTITPLTRAPIVPGQSSLFLIGDAARVVEPFTGEGIYYALRSGELAAEAAARIVRGEERQTVAGEFTRAHAAMYRGRLWINQLARAAVLSPRIASMFVHVARLQRPLLRMLTRQIVR